MESQQKTVTELLNKIQHDQQTLEEYTQKTEELDKSVETLKRQLAARLHSQGCKTGQFNHQGQIWSYSIETLHGDPERVYFSRLEPFYIIPLEDIDKQHD